jgi:hypothetical protein
LNRIMGRALDQPAPTIDALAAVFTPESWARLEVSIARAIKTGASYELDREMVREDGTTCWTTARGEAARPGGDVVMLGHGPRIDERKRAEHRGWDREAGLREAQRIAGIGLQWTIATGIITHSRKAGPNPGRGLKLSASVSRPLIPASTRRKLAAVGRRDPGAIETGAHELRLKWSAPTATCWTDARRSVGERKRRRDAAGDRTTSTTASARRCSCLC